jgi:hypothetical protein
LAAFASVSQAADPAPEKPVLLYSRYHNAEGETRYLPDGTFQQILRKLGDHFTVRIHRDPLNSATLADVQLLLIANPSDQAVGSNAAPPHMSMGEARVLMRFISQGAGLIVMGNQENHNLEVQDMNLLLSRFGLSFTNLYTDAKMLVIPAGTPIVGGLRWAYYTGNLVDVQSNHYVHPQALVINDLSVKPIKGTRDQAGALLAIAEPGAGRVAVITDTGFITDDALSGKGIGEVSIKEHDNAEIFIRLARWAGRVTDDKHHGEYNPKLIPRSRSSTRSSSSSSRSGSSPR